MSDSKTGTNRFGKIKNILTSIGLFSHCFIFNFIIMYCYLVYGISGKGREHGHIPFIIYSLIATIINVFPLLIMSTKKFLPKASIVTALLTNVLASSFNFSIFLLYNLNFSIPADIFFFVANLFTYLIILSISIISAIIRNKD